MIRLLKIYFKKYEEVSFHMHLPPLLLGKTITSENPLAFLDFELPDKLAASGTL